MEKTIQVLVVFHAVLGGLALVSGGFAMSAQKGGALHKKSGKVFYYSMLGSALVSLVVAAMPGHYDPFLFCIGIFSLYLLLAGYRALRFKRTSIGLGVDRVIAAAMGIVGLVMIFYPIVLGGVMNTVLFVFGLAGVVFGIVDLKNYRNKHTLKKKWLKIHLGKMTGAYIAAVSAFLVVNQFFYPLLNWFLPTILGSVFISYWMRKVRKKSQQEKTV